MGKDKAEGFQRSDVGLPVVALQDLPQAGRVTVPATTAGTVREYRSRDLALVQFEGFDGERAVFYWDVKLGPAPVTV